MTADNIIKIPCLKVKDQSSGDAQTPIAWPERGSSTPRSGEGAGEGAGARVAVVTNGRADEQGFCSLLR